MLTMLCVYLPTEDPSFNGNLIEATRESGCGLLSFWERFSNRVDNAEGARHEKNLWILGRD